MKKRWPGFLLFALLLVLWEMGSALGLVDSVSIPRVSVIVASWIDTLRTGNVRCHLPSLGASSRASGLRVLVAVPLGLADGRQSSGLSAARAPHRVHPADPGAAYIPVAILFLGLATR